MEERRLKNAINNWLVNFKQYSVKPATYDRLKISAGLMARYDIAYILEQDLTCDDIQVYVNQLMRDGYSLSTIKKQYTLLTAYLKYAYSRGRISSPLYLGIEMPRQANIAKPKKQVEAYSADEERRLKSVLMTLEHGTYGLSLLMLENGIRVGEAQCLTWDDILWDRQAICIHKTLVRLSSEHGVRFIQDSAKSATSNRTIPISDLAMNTLKRMHCSRDERSELLFPDDSNPLLPCTYETVRYHLRIACEKAGVEYRGTHALRHTFATDAYHRDPSNVKSLSKVLGHADTALTYNTYIHLYGDGLEEMRKVLG